MASPAPEPAPLATLGRTGLCYNLKFAAFVVTLLPLLLALGAWQLWRAEEKSRVLAQYETRRAAPPLPLSSFVPSDGPALDGRRVELRGRFVASRSFLLDNRVWQGRVGYELITPLREETGNIVFVNRGWLLAPPLRSTLPELDTPAGELCLLGEFHVPARRRALPLYPAPGWPRVVQSIDVEEMGRLAGIEPYPHLVRLSPGQPGVTEHAEWPRVNILPQRHVAYATQWFLLAAVLLAVFLLGGTNLREWLRERRARQHRDARDE